jgi:hypothetical protein
MPMAVNMVGVGGSSRGAKAPRQKHASVFTRRASLRRVLNACIFDEQRICEARAAGH